MRKRTNPPRPLGSARLLLAGLLCLAMLLVLAPAASAAQRLARPYALSYNLRLSGDAASQDRQAQAVARSAESARHPVWWNEVEPSKGTFQIAEEIASTDRCA